MISLVYIIFACCKSSAWIFGNFGCLHFLKTREIEGIEEIVEIFWMYFIFCAINILSFWSIFRFLDEFLFCDAWTIGTHPSIEKRYSYTFPSKISPLQIFADSLAISFSIKFSFNLLDWFIISFFFHSFNTLLGFLVFHSPIYHLLWIFLVFFSSHLVLL